MLFAGHGGDHRRPVEIHARQPGARRGPGLLHRAVILPDGATLERTDKVVAEVEEAISPIRPTRTSSPSPASISSAAASATTPRRIFVTQIPWDERKVTAQAAGRRAVREDRRTSRKRWCSPSTRRRSSGWATPAASSSTSRTAAKAARKRMNEVTQQFLARVNTRPGAWLRANAVARQRAAALRGRRPREGEDARRADQRRVQHARRHARQLLRERLQQVRAHLAGADVGGPVLPHAPGRHQRRCTCVPPRAR